MAKGGPKKAQAPSLLLRSVGHAVVHATTAWTLTTPIAAASIVCSVATPETTLLWRVKRKGKL